MAAVYAFCRVADDLADETGCDATARQRSRAMLAELRAEVARGWEGKARHPVIVALADCARRTGIEPGLCMDLIGAFEHDQQVTRYAGLQELLAYSRGSANPVGRMVLRLAMPGSARDQLPAAMLGMSDAICTALQLTNFWQDVRRDFLDRDRVYLPLAEMEIAEAELVGTVERTGPADPAFARRYERAMSELITQTRAMFNAGRGLCDMMPRGWGPVISLFVEGGQATLARVEQAGVTVLQTRPALSRARKAMMVGRAWVRAKWLGDGTQASSQKARPGPEASHPG
jgi:squalene synthase HpnC